MKIICKSVSSDSREWWKFLMASPMAAWRMRSVRRLFPLRQGMACWSPWRRGSRRGFRNTGAICAIEFSCPCRDSDLTNEAIRPQR